MNGDDALDAELPANVSYYSTFDKLAASLAKAQRQMTNASKDAENPHYRSKYADLASVWEACREALSSNGLSVVQLPELDGNLVRVTTRLLHESGQQISNVLSATPQKTDPQGIGSTITYLRRYALAAMVGVAPAEDDAEAATDHGNKKSAPLRNVNAAEKTERKAEPTAVLDVQKFRAAFKEAKTLDALTAAWKELTAAASTTARPTDAQKEELSMYYTEERDRIKKDALGGKS